MDDLRDIVAMRRRMAERLADFSETYREEVWNQLQSKIEARETTEETPSFLAPSPADQNDELSRLIDGELSDADVEVSRADAEIAGLLTAVNRRRHAAQMASQLAEERRDSIWQRVRASIVRREADRLDRPERRSFAPRWALAGAAAALVIAAIGPVPATGFAHHPVAEAVRYAGHHLGITETSTAPAPPATDTTVHPVNASAAEAAAALGIAVTAPDSIDRFTLTASQLFSEPITADSGGAFVLTYQGSDPAQSIIVYQEGASGANLTAAGGSAESIALPDGTPAAYVDGSWQATPDGLSWVFGGTQTLLFERDGVRTILRYSGPPMAPADLAAIAAAFTG